MSAKPAKPEAEEESEVPAPAAPAPAKRKPWLLIGIVVLACAAGGVAYFTLKGGKAPATAEGQPGAKDGRTASAPKTKAAAQYLALTPAFVVNLGDTETARYLQVEMEVMARDSAALDATKAHMPKIRNNILLLLGSRQVSDLASREGKDKLRADVTAEIQSVLREETGKPHIEAVFFDSFVMQ